MFKNVLRHKIHLHFFAFIMLVLVSIILIDRWVAFSTSNQIHTDTNNLPGYHVGLVLGTSKYLKESGINQYYKERITIATDLYYQNKIQYLLLSGDNADKSYNEPWTMKRDILRAGVYESDIFLDYAGFRTLDSIIRAKEVFHINDFLIITQYQHCQRALFIANYHNIKADCFAVNSNINSDMKFNFREFLARNKAILDLYILGKQPKFLGEMTPIHLD